MKQVLKRRKACRLSGFMLFCVFLSCGIERQQKISCHQEMIAILERLNKEYAHPRNQFAPEAKLPFMDSLLTLPHSKPAEIRYCNYLKANILLELGQEGEAIAILESLVRETSQFEPPTIKKALAIAYMRQAERSNCITNHASESCIAPIHGVGLHRDTEWSRKAIQVYKAILKKDPMDFESRWLLNVAYMTLGEYPLQVPPALLIPGMEGDTTHRVKPFEDIAGSLGLDIRNMAGGSLTEDFDNDGYLDLMLCAMGITESMHYFRNNADGTFTDLTNKAGLQQITGGLNLVQTDYNNDGYKDVFVLRGAWKLEYGREPNSLLRNNGDGTFTDVTTESGLLSFHPTQTATWNDFNNDGWLDVFIGNESVVSILEQQHPCELYINNQDGTFREIASQAHCNVVNYVKGVTSGDYDHDGWPDIFLSTLDNKRILLKNKGDAGKEIEFQDVTIEAGLSREKGKTFPTWFFDYDNDGWLDIFACDYTFTKSLGHYEAAEKLNIAMGNPEKMLLYHNNHDGTFTNVANETGLTTHVFSMGANFGDIDNDGFLDMYLGSGNPLYQSIVPNKMFKNSGGKKFVDVTNSARVGHLQKGHGVSFADMDNDGDQDIYIDMGGAYPGDAYQNSFFMNPGQNDNNWICVNLQGTRSNRAAIGTTIKVSFRENGVARSVYREVNSGGSFGSSPLRKEIGIGMAPVIDELEITWHPSGMKQTFTNIKPNQFIEITEGSNEIAYTKLQAISWVLPERLCLPEISAKK